MKKQWIPWVFLAPSLLGVFLFILLPFLDVVRRSFYGAVGEKFVGLENYGNVITNQAFLTAGKNTLRFILVCIPLLLVLSFLLALLLEKREKFREFFKTVFLMPMAVPVASVAFLWNVFFQKAGLINALLSYLGKENIEFIDSSKAFGLLVFSYLWKNTGYDMILWLAGLSGIPKSYYEAAKVDGAGPFACFWYITLPSLKSFGIMIFVLSFINSFKVFREAYLIAGSYPHESIYMLQHLFNNWFLSLDIQKMSASAVMLAIIVLAVTAVLLRKGEEEMV